MKGRPKIQVVIEKDGQVLGRLERITDISYYLHISNTTTYKMLKRGYVVDGVKLRYMKEGENGIPFIRTDRPKPPKKPRKKAPPIKFKGEKFDTRNKSLHYEVLNNRICITPCPCRDEIDRPKVGSAACMACGSNHGRNKDTQEVACSLFK